MRVSLISFFILVLNFYSSGQDTLNYRDGTKEVVQLIEIGHSFVRYYKWGENPDSTIYNVSSQVVSSVTYNDGKSLGLLYNNQPESYNSQPEPLIIIPKKRIPPSHLD